MTIRCKHIIWILILVTACRNQTQEDHANHDMTKSGDAIHETVNPVNQVVLSSQKTIKLSQAKNEQTIKVKGYIAFDERRNNKVSFRASGRIERLYVKYNYQYVKRGERIAELYSPELSTYQEEYLFLVKNGEDSLAAGAKEKLKLLGFPDNQISQLEKSGIVTQTITIASPLDGFIRFSSTSSSSGEVKGSSLLAMEGMTETSSNSGTQIASSGQIKEGIYVSKGQTLFTVNDCRQVWAILSPDVNNQVELKKGLVVTLHSEVWDEPIKATIDLVEPVYQDKQRFTQARIYLDNPQRKFKINSLIKGEVVIQTQALTVPLSSVYDLGSRKIVWIKKGTTSDGVGMFEPREVLIGSTSDNRVEIVSGLKGIEEIALDAGYMIDSESILKVMR